MSQDRHVLIIATLLRHPEGRTYAQLQDDCEVLGQNFSDLTRILVEFGKKNIVIRNGETYSLVNSFRAAIRARLKVVRCKKAS